MCGDGLSVAGKSLVKKGGEALVDETRILRGRAWQDALNNPSSVSIRAPNKGIFKDTARADRAAVTAEGKANQLLILPPAQPVVKTPTAPALPTISLPGLTTSLQKVRNVVAGKLPIGAVRDGIGAARRNIEQGLFQFKQQSLQRWANFTFGVKKHWTAKQLQLKRMWAGQRQEVAAFKKKGAVEETKASASFNPSVTVSTPAKSQPVNPVKVARSPAETAKPQNIARNKGAGAALQQQERGNKQPKSETLIQKAKAQPQYIPKGPMIGKRVGQTFKKHESHNTEQLTAAAPGLTTAEKQVFKELQAAGHNVQIIPRAGEQTADFLVNGVTTELKTLASAGANTLKNAIQNAAKQGENILIDARNVAIDAQNAAQQIQRAQGNVGNLQGRVTVLTKEGSVKF